MKVREGMVTNPVTARLDDLVYEAAKTMRDKKIGSIICVDKEKVLGIITERDLVRRVMAEAKDPKTIKIRDVMSTPVISVSPEEDVVDAAQLMTRSGVRRLVVMKGNKLVGILTSDDLAGNMKRAVEELATALYIIGRQSKYK